MPNPEYVFITGPIVRWADDETFVVLDLNDGKEYRRWIGNDWTFDYQFEADIVEAQDFSAEAHIGKTVHFYHHDHEE